MEQINPDFALNLRAVSQMGVISRLSRTLISSSTYDELFAALDNAFDELSIDGYLLVNTDKINKKIKLGAGCSKEVIETLLSDSNRDKICTLETCVRVCNPSVILICCTRANNHFDDNIDCLATLCDIAQEYIEHIQDVESHQLDHKHKQLSAAESVHDVLQCLTVLNKHLVTQGNVIIEELHCRLLKMFPCLSLDYDQEEEIIKLIDSTSKDMKSLVEAQTLYNRDLEYILKETVSALVVEFDDQYGRSTASGKGNQNAIEIFDHKMRMN